MRRSLRSRRVATRAWCTPSSPASSRTTGSWSSRRRTAEATASWNDSQRRGVLAHRADVRIAGRQRTRAERPGQLGHVVGLAGAGLAQDVDDGVDDRIRSAGRRLDLDLAEPQTDPIVVEGRHHVVAEQAERTARPDRVMGTTVRWVWRCAT